GLRLKVKGDGQRYKLILRNNDGWDSPGYIHSFETTADARTVVDIPFDELVPTFRARSLPDAAPFDPARIVSLQLMLSKFEYDQRLNPQFTAGPFQLVVSDIGAYRPRWGVPLVAIAQDKAEYERLQAALANAPVDYRLIEPGREDLLGAITQALA
ncbi:MAG: CIA30 family protein, partial [Phormidesmis sp.]